MNKKWMSLLLTAVVLLGTFGGGNDLAAKEVNQESESIERETETAMDNSNKSEKIHMQEASVLGTEMPAKEQADTSEPINMPPEADVPKQESAPPAADIAYILGRPLTEEEKAAEQALEPKLSNLPEENFDIPMIADEALGGKARSIGGIDAKAQEASYDPRAANLITPIRTQSAETCWAYSSIAAGEQSLISKGAVLKDGPASPLTLDLSEAQMTYYFYHPVTDPLGNTKGDGNQNISPFSYLNVGSSTIFSTFALANWVGAANEKDMTMDDLYNEKPFDDSLAYEKDAAHMQNAYWINFKDTDAVNSVKQMIKQYGGTAINFYYQNNYYNNDTKAYYYPLNAKQANNHSVTLVGWDDNYKKENFKQGKQPTADGAWIVKNSYGPDWGDHGYFYLSYQDNAVNTNNTNVNRARAFVFDFESADNYSNNYQYDGTAGAYNCSFSSDGNTKVASGASVANVFKVSEQSLSDYETLKAVSFALYDTMTNYSIQIYKNPADAQNPDSGTPMLDTPKTGTTSYVGYYTVKLDQEVRLNRGDSFAVVITYAKDSGNDINFFVDATYSNGGWVSFVNAAEKGQSYKMADGKWKDLAQEGMTARIKAFTDDHIIPAQKVSLASMEGLTQQADGSYALTLWSDKTYRLAADIYPKNATYQQLDWASANTSVLKVDEEGNLTAVSPGEAVITGTSKDGSGLKVICKVTVKIRAVSLQLDKKKIALMVGEQQKLSASVIPDSATDAAITYTSSDAKVAAVDTTGNIRALYPGKAVITAALSDGSNLTANCSLTVIEEETEEETETEIEGTIVEQGNTTAEGTIDATGADSASTLDNTPIGILMILCITSGGYLWYFKKHKKDYKDDGLL